MPPKGSKAAPKRKAEETTPAETPAAQEPATDANTAGRRSGRNADKPAGSYGGPVPRAKKPKTAEEKPAEGETTEEKTEEKTADDAPPPQEQSNKVAEEVPEKATEAASTAVDAEAESGALASGAVKVGETIPLDVTLNTEEDKEVSVKDLVAEKGCVFFLYPKANTPGCTTQACSYRDNYDEFKQLNYEVYGLSQDNPKPLATWKAKQNFQYTLLSDPKQSLIKALGGSKTAKTVNRSHWVVEKGGKLLLASIGVKPAESQKATIEFIKAL